MPDDELHSERPRRRAAALLIAAALAAGGLALSCGLFLGAVRLGLVSPPGFTVPLGDRWIVAPCPAEMHCPDELPFYAVWEGRRMADGSTNYKLRFFTYLRR